MQQSIYMGLREPLAAREQKELQWDLVRAVEGARLEAVERLLLWGVQPQPIIDWLGRILADPFHEACKGLADPDCFIEKQQREILRLLKTANPVGFLTHAIEVPWPGKEETLSMKPIHRAIVSLKVESEESCLFLEELLCTDGMEVDSLARALLEAKGLFWDEVGLLQPFSPKISELLSQFSEL